MQEGARWGQERPRMHPFIFPLQGLRPSSELQGLKPRSLGSLSRPARALGQTVVPAVFIHRLKPRCSGAGTRGSRLVPVSWPGKEGDSEPCAPGQAGQGSCRAPGAAVPTGALCPPQPRGRRPGAGLGADGGSGCESEPVRRLTQSILLAGGPGGVALAPRRVEARLGGQDVGPHGRGGLSWAAPPTRLRRPRPARAAVGGGAAGVADAPAGPAVPRGLRRPRRRS